MPVSSPQVLERVKVNKGLQNFYPLVFEFLNFPLQEASGCYIGGSGGIQLTPGRFSNLIREDGQFQSILGASRIIPGRQEGARISR